MKQGFICRFNYGATGEGFHQAIGFVVAGTESAAKRQFLTDTYCSWVKEWEEATPEQKAASLKHNLDHFENAVRVWYLSEVKTHSHLAGEVEHALNGYCSVPVVREIMEAIDHGGALHEFLFHLYTNYS